MSRLEIVECPRDAMQGIDTFISTDKKVAYINALLQVGYSTLDCGSFVSPKAIPQLKDTREVLSKIDRSKSVTKLLTIVGNARGAEDAAALEEVDCLGFPFSISDTFQRRNINSTVDESFKRVETIREIAFKANKEPIIYISMAFGNPYGDLWDKDVAIYWGKRLYDELEIKTISLSDTIGVATPAVISYIFNAMVPELPEVDLGAHLHTTWDTADEKITAAWDSGCRRMDGAIKGFGGCPMAEDELIGNMPTEMLLAFAERQQLETGLDQEAFNRAMSLTNHVFPAH